MPTAALGSTAAIHDTEDVRRRLARLVSCYTSACLPYPPQTRRAACRCAYQGRENGARLMGGSVRARAPDWGGCSYDGEGKGGAHRDREVQGRWRRTIAAWTATWKGLLAAEGVAYAVLVRGRGTDGRDGTEGLIVSVYACSVGQASSSRRQAGRWLWTRGQYITI